MRPWSDIEAGRQLAWYGVVFTMLRRNDTGQVEIFILDREEVNIEELQDEPIIRQ